MPHTLRTTDDLVTDGWKERTLAGFADRFGPLWTKKNGSGWSYGVLASAHHLNPAGFVHGGALLSLFDHVVSSVAWEAVDRKPCVTVQSSAQFLSAARAGQFLRMDACVTKTTKTLIFMGGSITANSVDIFQGSAVLKIMEAGTTEKKS